MVGPILGMAHYTSSEESGSDIDEDILSLHQDSQTSSRTTLRSNSPAVTPQGTVLGQILHQTGNTGTTLSAASGDCEHIHELLEDPTHAARFLKRHRALVRWGAQAKFDAAVSHTTVERPSKRRKVRMTIQYS